MQWRPLFSRHSENTKLVTGWAGWNKQKHERCQAQKKKKRKKKTDTNKRTCTPRRTRETQRSLWRCLSSKDVKQTYVCMRVCLSGGMLSTVIPVRRLSVFRQALSPAGSVTEWVQWYNAIQNSRVALNRSGSRAVQMHGADRTRRAGIPANLPEHPPAALAPF